MERLGQFATRMNLTNEQAKATDNDIVEHAFLIWQLDEERANLEKGTSKTQ